ncbi:hypothetical protein [Pseudolysinimonas sp.]|jgi:hypothetical protein
MVDRIVSPGSEISPDTDVVADAERIAPGTRATPSEPNPDALVEGNRVATAEDME